MCPLCVFLFCPPHRDCLALCFLNSGTSFIAGFAIFSILGFMSYEQNLPISEVAESGKILSYVSIKKKKSHHTTRSDSTFDENRPCRQVQVWPL